MKSYLRHLENHWTSNVKVVSCADVVGAIYSITNKNDVFFYIYNFKLFLYYFYIIVLLY